MIEKPILHSLSCAGEYHERWGEMSLSVWETSTGKDIYTTVIDGGSSALAEFFAIVAAVKTQFNRNMQVPIYSRDSYAIGCILRGFTDAYIDPITRWDNDIEELAEESANFIEDCPIKYEVLKWNTREWGNMMSRFGTRYASKESIEKTKRAISEL